MSKNAIELKASFGDEGIPKRRHALYAPIHKTDAVSALESGVPYYEGKAFLSTDFVYSHSLVKQYSAYDVSEAGSIMLFALPEFAKLGSAIYTSAFVNLEEKTISGSPIKYVAARRQLSVYGGDPEASRIHIEASAASGFSPDQQARKFLESRNCVGSIALHPSLDVIIGQLVVSVAAFERVDSAKVKRALSDVFVPSPITNAEAVSAGIDDIILGTIEAQVISRLRMVRWQILAELGFQFHEGDRAILIPKDESFHDARKSLDELGRRLASSQLFTGPLAWLMNYVAHQLEMNRVEIEGADLQNRTD